MASEKQAFYVPMGAMKAEANETYTTENISSAADTVVLVRGVRIVDENGKETPIRGARVNITNTETDATVPVPNVPFIWVEGFEMGFKAGYTYSFLDSCIIGFGIKTVVVV